jgi:flagellum-specific ATP synthase
MNGIDLARYSSIVQRLDPLVRVGVVHQVHGLVVEADMLGFVIGDLCRIYPRNSRFPITAEVVSFRRNRALLLPLGDLQGIGPGCRVVSQREQVQIDVGQGIVGRVIDGVGRPLDGKGPVITDTRYPLYAHPINPLRRRRISVPMDVGVKSINGLLTLGRGQRVGIFSGSGVGKSTLLGMIARYAESEVNVVALIGERSREVRDFIERDLGQKALERSVVVSATSEQPALVRLRAAYQAIAIAEYFRDQGCDVIFMMDSITRLAMAQREVGMVSKEPPAARGYTPSVFDLLPRYLERAGTVEGRGSITGIFTVLVEEDDLNEPISAAVKAVLDGHLQLSKELAVQNHYPPISVLESVSRVMRDIVGSEHQRAANWFMELLAAHRRTEDLINIGAYVAGTNPVVDEAIEQIDAFRGYLRQEVETGCDLKKSLELLEELYSSRKVGVQP